MRTRPNATSNSFKSSMSFHSSDLSIRDYQTCGEIFDFIRGQIGNTMKHSLLQNFDYEKNNFLINKYSFQKIDTGTAILINSAYKHNFSTTYDEFLYTIAIPVSVSCENSWEAKLDYRNNERILFNIPRGKCHFSNHDFLLQLPSGEQFQLAVNGFYDNEFYSADNNVGVHIERLSFRRIN
jgi:hypothetical protein